MLVVGDVNATLATTLAAKKLQIRVARVEAGLRSGDMGTPQEINRIVTDSVSDWPFVTESAATANLRREGTPEREPATGARVHGKDQRDGHPHARQSGDMFPVWSVQFRQQIL